MHHKKYSRKAVVFFLKKLKIRRWSQWPCGIRFEVKDSEPLEYRDQRFESRSRHWFAPAFSEVLSFPAYVRTLRPCTWPISHPGSHIECPRDLILSRPLWLCGLMRRSAAVWLLGPRVRILFRAWLSFSCVSCVVWVEAFATGWSLVQRSPTGCDVSLCDL